jgi:ADP-heptose:LPS heptosyltransferase
MNILFITASRIGDAVLSTGLLDYMAQKYPDAKVTVACGPLAVSLFEGCPWVERIIPVKKRKFHGHWFDVWRGVVARRWDMVVDLRNSAVSRLVVAKERHILGPHIDKQRHKVAQNAAVMGLGPEEIPAPKLWFTAEQMAFADGVIGGASGAVIGVGPAANWGAKTWPAERFIEVLKWLRRASGPFPRAKIAVFGAPGEEGVCQTVIDALPADAVINAVAKGSPGEAAAALSRCDFYIGNDSGLMHAAAAVGVPTFGLFGPSWPRLYAPWGDHCAYVSTPLNFAELTNYPGYTPQSAPCLMEGLSVDDVKEAIAEFLGDKA